MNEITLDKKNVFYPIRKRKKSHVFLCFPVFAFFYLASEIYFPSSQYLSLAFPEKRNWSLSVILRIFAIARGRHLHFIKGSEYLASMRFLCGKEKIDSCHISTLSAYSAKLLTFIQFMLDNESESMIFSEYLYLFYLLLIVVYSCLGQASM